MALLNLLLWIDIDINYVNVLKTGVIVASHCIIAL